MRSCGACWSPAAIRLGAEGFEDVFEYPQLARRIKPGQR